MKNSTQKQVETRRKKNYTLVSLVIGGAVVLGGLIYEVYRLNNKVDALYSKIYFDDHIKNLENIREYERTTFSESGFVSRVIDGDTVIINSENVRLLGIDTDEKGEKCYQEAKNRLEELVLGKEVRMERDIEDKDQYNRKLRYLFVEDKNINLTLVEEGLAIARFYKNKKYKKEILDAEKKAMINKVGCKWSEN